MDKKTFEGYRVPAIRENAQRSHTVLILCIDLFNTKHPPCNPKINKREQVMLIKKHRGLTRDKLRYLIRFLTDQIVDRLSKQHSWDRFQSKDADDLLDVFISENVDYLLKMVYRKYPQKRAYPSGEIFASEESRMAGVVAHLIDVVQSAETDLLRWMPHNPKLLTR